MSKKGAARPIESAIRNLDATGEQEKQTAVAATLSRRPAIRVSTPGVNDSVVAGQNCTLS